MAKKNIIKLIPIIGTITLLPFFVIACSINSIETGQPLEGTEDTPDIVLEDANEKMPENADILPVAIFANSVKATEINFSAWIYHSNLAYNKTYQAVFVEANSADADGNFKYVKSLPFKLDENQNSFSKDQENGINREEEIKKYNQAVEKQKAGDKSVKEPKMSPFYKQQVNNIKIKNLTPKKEYILTNIIFNDNGQEKSLWNIDTNNPKHLYLDTVDSQFSASTKRYTKEYDPKTNEMILTYFVNTKKLVDGPTNWTYKLNLGIEKIESSEKKITSFYTSKIAYKATNFDTFNADIAFEVRIKLSSSQQIFKIKSANIASIFSYEKTAGNNPDDKFEDIYITPIQKSI